MNKFFLSAVIAASFALTAPVHAQEAAKTEPAKPAVTKTDSAGIGAVDTNNDGAVSKSEADAVALAQFTAFDENKDGKIAESEFQSEIFKMHKTPPPADQKAQIEKMIAGRFTGLDGNKDGSVTKAEYMEDATRRHKMMDLDGDGKVTKKELGELKAKIEAQMKKQLAAQKKPAAK